MFWNVFWIISNAIKAYHVFNCLGQCVQIIIFIVIIAVSWQQDVEEDNVIHMDCVKSYTRLWHERKAVLEFCLTKVHFHVFTEKHSHFVF